MVIGREASIWFALLSGVRPPGCCIGDVRSKSKRTCDYYFQPCTVRSCICRVLSCVGVTNQMDSKHAKTPLLFHGLYELAWGCSAFRLSPPVFCRRASFSSCCSFTSQSCTTSSTWCQARTGFTGGSTSWQTTLRYCPRFIFGQYFSPCLEGTPCVRSSFLFLFFQQSRTIEKYMYSSVPECCSLRYSRISGPHEARHCCRG